MPALIDARIYASADVWSDSYGGHDYSLWCASGDALRRIGSAAVPVLISRLKDEDAKTRLEAAESLGSIGPAAAAAVPALITLLKDERKVLIAEAVQAEWGFEADYTPEVRRCAVEALGRIGPAAMPALLNALGDQEEGVRRCAVEALGRIGPAAMPALLNALGDQEEGVRRRAVEALGRIGPAAMPALLNALGDQEEGVRGCAAEALVEMRWE